MLILENSGRAFAFKLLAMPLASFGVIYQVIAAFFNAEDLPQLAQFSYRQTDMEIAVTERAI